MSENKSILQALRKNAGKTQDQVAEYMDVTTNTIQNWESNPSQMKEKQLCKLLDFYHATQKERDFIDAVASHEYQLKKAREKGQQRASVPPFLGIVRSERSDHMPA